MFDKESVKALQEGESIRAAYNTITAAIEQSEGTVTALPSDYKLHDLEPYLSNRRRARGTMGTTSIQSFASYTKNNCEHGSTVFIDSDSMSATAVLNLGTPDTPGHADNKAVLKAEKTAAYRALISIATGQGKAQKDVAEFLEDWAENVKCRNDAGDIKTSQAVAAVRKVTIESMRKLESEEQSLSASRSAFESVQASSKEPLPTHILFSCEPYNGLEVRFFELRLGVLTGEATPKINLRIVKAEEHQEQMADEMGAKINEAIDNTMPVLMGSYSKTM